VSLDPIRVRLLPAGVLVLAELARRLHQPLRICKGGLREGVIMEMMGRPE
jgi:exopolyphosphatase / guanosine-5'-triphosphate,3'-diphosphate pyrophosphatase